MTVLKVPGMHCEHCVKRIKDALAAVELECDISLEDKTVTVLGCTVCGNCVDSAIAEIEDLGFEVEKA